MPSVILAAAGLLHCRDNTDLGVDIPADLNARAIERIQNTPLQYPVRFVITGDVHPPGYVRFAGMSEQINALEPPPLFVIIVGDLTGTGTILEYKDYTLVLENFDPPVVSIAGNREQYHAAGLSTFRLVVGPEDFFFDYYQFRFIALNSSRPYNYGLDEDQLDWLDERLSEVQDELAFIFMHNSVFPQSRGGERYFSILDKYRDRVAFQATANKHAFARFEVDGFEYIVSGGGGGGLSTGWSTDPFEPPIWDFIYHFVVIDISADGEITGKVIKLGEGIVPDQQYDFQIENPRRKYFSRPLVLTAAIK